MNGSRRVLVAMPRALLRTSRSRRPRPAELLNKKSNDHMSILKNIFFSEKVNRLFDTYPYIILFHHNNMKSKEWLSIKKKLHQINPSILMKVIPNRFLSQTISHYQIECPLGGASPRQRPKPAPNEQLRIQQELTNQKYNLGSCCLFFCLTLNDLKNIIEPAQKLSQGVLLKNSLLNFNSFDESSSSNPNLKSNALKFLNIGMIHSDKLKNMVFFNPYDINKILEFVSLTTNSNADTVGLNNAEKVFSLQLCNELTFQNINFINNFYEFTNFSLNIFTSQQYNLYNILQHQYNLKKSLSEGSVDDVVLK